MFRLVDGDLCSIRDGGTSSILRSHPTWVVSYYCRHAGAVWMRPSAAHFGINESARSWTVATASASGTGKLTTRHIARAWFVGTRSG
jgi:hypothetical protein